MRVARPFRSVSLLVSAATALAGVAFASPASAAELLSVKNESANFREGPGEKHAIVYSADRFYPVEVVEKKDAWVKVKDFEGDVAWVAERLLTKQETIVVEGDRVNVRDKAGTTAEIVFKAERGEVFKVEERQGKWLRVVDANGDGGWVRDDMVWGERMPAAAAPKGKTKGELEDPAKAAVVKEPAAKGASKAKGDEDEAKPAVAADAEPKKEPKAQADKPKEKEAKPSEKPAEKKADEAPKDAPAEKPAAEEAPTKEAPSKEAPAKEEEKPASKDEDQG